MTQSKWIALFVSLGVLASDGGHAGMLLTRTAISSANARLVVAASPKPALSQTVVAVALEPVSIIPSPRPSYKLVDTRPLPQIQQPIAVSTPVPPVFVQDPVPSDPVVAPDPVASSPVPVGDSAPPVAAEPSPQPSTAQPGGDSVPPVVAGAGGGSNSGLADCLGDLSALKGRERAKKVRECLKGSHKDRGPASGHHDGGGVCMNSNAESGGGSPSGGSDSTGATAGSGK